MSPARFPSTRRTTSSGPTSEPSPEWQVLAQKIVAYPQDFGMSRRDVEPLAKKLAQTRER